MYAYFKKRKEIETMEQSRWKSPVLWLSIAALIAFVTKTWIGYEIPEFDTFVQLILSAAIAFGIVNSPDNKDRL